MNERLQALAAHVLQIFNETMIFFLNELPANLEPNGLYFISNGDGTADLYVGDATGRSTVVAAGIATSNHLQGVKNQANGVAGLDANTRLSESVMPSSFQTATQINATVQSQVNSLVSAAPGALDTLDELANALGDDPNFATTMTNQLAGKQATLSNATEVAKLGNGTFDGKPLVVVSSAEW